MMFTPYPVEGVDPLVAALFRICNEKKITRLDLARLSGVSAPTILEWQKGRSPRSNLISCCFEVVGYSVFVRRKRQRKPFFNLESSDD